MPVSIALFANRFKDSPKKPDQNVVLEFTPQDVQDMMMAVQQGQLEPNRDQVMVLKIKGATWSPQNPHANSPLCSGRLEMPSEKAQRMANAPQQAPQTFQPQGQPPQQFQQPAPQAAPQAAPQWQAAPQAAPAPVGQVAAPAPVAPPAAPVFQPPAPQAPAAAGNPWGAPPTGF